jgi:hypothetical protein
MDKNLEEIIRKRIAKRLARSGRVSDKLNGKQYIRAGVATEILNLPINKRRYFADLSDNKKALAELKSDSIEIEFIKSMQDYGVYISEDSIVEIASYLNKGGELPEIK